MGGVVGNVAFGFMMGCAFLIGDFTGQPFDILDSQNYISAYSKEGNNSVENKNLLIFN